MQHCFHYKRFVHFYDKYILGMFTSFGNVCGGDGFEVFNYFQLYWEGLGVLACPFVIIP